jgi:hypothetical protein
MREELVDDLMIVDLIEPQNAKFTDLSLVRADSTAKQIGRAGEKATFMNRWQKLVEIAKMVLAELPRGVAERPQHGSVDDGVEPGRGVAIEPFPLDG